MAAYRGVVITWSNIYNGLELSSYFLSHVNSFCQKPSSIELEISLCLRDLNIELTLSPSLQIKPKKYSARKHVWHHFWKGERLWWDRKQNESLCRNSHPKGSLKKALWEIWPNSQKILCTGISVLVFPCNFCKICKDTFFAEQYRTTASHYNSINSYKDSIGKRNYCKLWSKN